MSSLASAATSTTLPMVTASLVTTASPVLTAVHAICSSAMRTIIEPVQLRGRTGGRIDQRPHDVAVLPTGCRAYHVDPPPSGHPRRETIEAPAVAIGFGGEDRRTRPAQSRERDAGSHLATTESRQPGVAEPLRCLDQGPDGAVVLDPDKRRCQAAGGNDLDDLEYGPEVGQPHASGVEVETVDGHDLGCVGLERSAKQHAI